MKKILLRLALFILTIAILDRAFVYFFSKNIFSKTISGESGGTVNYLLQKKHNNDFLILGSSRAKYHINPGLLSNVYNGNGYNAGISGTGGLIYNDLLLKLLLTKNIKPKVIILQADPYPYFVENKNLENEVLQLYPFLIESEVVRKYINESVGYIEKFKLLFHSYWYNGKFLNIIYNYVNRRSVLNNNGFVGLTGEFDTSGFIIAADLSKKHTYSEIKINALLSIIKTCEENKIRLCVVLPPSFRNSVFVKEGSQLLINLLRKNGVTAIYDFSDIEKYPELKPGYLWKDAVHLNNSGASLFSVLLNKEMAHLP